MADSFPSDSAPADPTPSDQPSLAAPAPASVPYQALYRRYRPQRFADVLGQRPVTQALTNAVREGRVAHAYLFSGPRGTGKTSTARILAMALNCENPQGGEPDGSCQSCLDIRRGSSLDVQELDAASNRKLDEMRDLLARVALGTRGRHKVYIIDEVHQLTPDAASALLKTLEEPPAHVVFVLATTDPQKVLPTIRSRTQHFEFRLLGADVLSSLLAGVNQQAGLGLSSAAIDLVVRKGHGSARDALSALDQVAAAGSVADDSTVVEQIVDAIADRDPPALLVAVAEAISAGRDPRRLVTELLEHLRNAFLATQAPSLVQLPSSALAGVQAQAHRMGAAALVRAMENLGEAAVAMRESVEPRITLEAALVRLAEPQLDTTLASLLERMERLERMVGERATATQGESPVLRGPDRASPGRGEAQGHQQEGSGPRRSPPGSAPEPPPPSPAGGSGAQGHGQRPALGAHRRAAGGRPSESLSRPTSSAPPPSGSPPSGSAPPGSSPPGSPPPQRRSAQLAPSAPVPTREELTKAWGDAVLPALRPGVKVYVSLGRFVSAGDGVAVFALPDRGLLSRAQPVVGEMEAALAAHFSVPVPIRLVLDDRAARPEAERGLTAGQGQGSDPSGNDPSGEDPSGEDPSGDDMSVYDLEQLQDADVAISSPEQRLLQAFPGAEEVTQ